MLKRRNKEIKLPDSIILMSDSYKYSQFVQYPKNTTRVRSYIESRGGDWDETVMFGLQAFMLRYLTVKVTHEMINEAEPIVLGNGEPFNRAGWEYIVDVLGGKLPLTIKALPEGTVVETQQVLAVVENTDDNCAWLTSFCETALLRAVWYGTTVATNSFVSKKIILEALIESGTPGDIAFKLNDFGARGVSSHESAGIGGAGHLVNFMGSDNIEAVVHARNFYDATIAGFSIPAMEHSTVTSWGRNGEEASFRNMLKQFGMKIGLTSNSPLIACVSDSYDIYKACELWGTKLKQDVIASGSVIVVRPDSGYPADVVLDCLKILAKHFGTVRNEKGFKVLNNVRVIQGDGIDHDMIRSILNIATINGFSADNIAFGQGGALLQQVNRDTLRFAMKCSALKADGVWIDVFKDPITDKGKVSKKGAVTLFRDYDGKFVSDLEANAAQYIEEALITVFENGETMNEIYWEDVVANAAKYFQ